MLFRSFPIHLVAVVLLTIVSQGESFTPCRHGIKKNDSFNVLISTKKIRTRKSSATKLWNTVSSINSRYIEKSKYEELLDWLQKQQVDNSNSINNNIYFEESNVGGGYGAFVSKDIAKDEILFEVPRSACVTLMDAVQDPKCGEEFLKILDKAGSNGGNTVVMAAYLAKEYLLSLVNDDDIKATTKFGPYLETLPWERGINNQEHVLFWTDEEVESTLKGSFCYREVCELRSEVALACKVIESSIVGDTIRIARGDMEEDNDEEDGGGIQWPWQIYNRMQKRNIVKEPVDGLDLAIRGAFVSLLTRSFQDRVNANNDEEGGDDIIEEKLVPLLDMLQHNEEANIRHSTRPTDGVVEVRARRDIKAGEELYNQYISEEDENMPYHRFFTRFGFVPGIIDTEDPIIDLFQDKSSIFYPKVVEI